MIAEIIQTTQYAKQGTNGPIQIDYQFGRTITCYAHSTEDALDWLRAFPMYKDAVIDNLHDGRILVTSVWTPYDNTVLDLLFDHEDESVKPLLQAKYEREQIFIVKRNTIYENTGFEAYRQPRD